MMGWNPATVEALPVLVLSLITASVLEVVLAQVYVWFGKLLSSWMGWAGG